MSWLQIGVRLRQRQNINTGGRLIMVGTAGTLRGDNQHVVGIFAFDCSSTYGGNHPGIDGMSGGQVLPVFHAMRRGDGEHGECRCWVTFLRGRSGIALGLLLVLCRWGE